MFKNRAENGRANLCGERVTQLRKGITPRLSQRALADRLQRAGLDVDKNAIQRIESGERFVSDIELAALADALGTTADDLLLRSHRP